MLTHSSFTQSSVVQSLPSSHIPAPVHSGGIPVDDDDTLALVLLEGPGPVVDEGDVLLVGAAPPVTS